MASSSLSSYSERQALRKAHLDSNDTFITGIPKVELHVHIEGTLTPALRWKLSQRNHIPLTAGSDKVPLKSLTQVEDAYTQIRGRIGAASAHGKTNMTFFEAYYGGFDLLQTEQDYYDLAMEYFERAAKMNVRYCEPFFDPQGHTRRGVGMDVLMRGLRQAQKEAEERLNVKSQWIMCILRDMSPESAMEAYLAALPYKNMIVGMGLDSDELDRPPSLFEEVFKRAKADGFKLTAHCDFNQKDTHKHIRQVAELLGAQRIDHGLNAADSEQLMELIASEGMGMTICPCAYIRHAGDVEVFPRIRRLFDAGIKAAIASDDPAYMEDNWVTNVLLMVKDKCNFSNHDIALLQLNAVEMSWADEGTKEELMKEIRHFVIFADADAESLRRSTMIGFFQWLKLRLLNEN